MLRRLLRLGLLVALAFYGACFLALLLVRRYEPPVTMVQIQRRVEALVSGQEYRPYRIWVDLDRLPPHVWRAVVAGEDTRFFEHHGFDWTEIVEAREELARGGRRRGASTITQQLVKNLFLTTHQSVVRKGIEITLTPLAELALPKRRILELYVNSIEFGPGMFGIEAGARHHFDQPAHELTREQAAQLAAIIPAPLRRTPRSSGWYADIILRRMQVLGW
ncbi:MAG TPA: monofunctional biosynthetic peptidoglycan transglycosylase [Gemmatimonadaceae bacterium]|nr:monofunctional biosynthetic peptidoglycan transglycosylase [Gemmatimonadaceae bacterium]